MFCNTQAHVQHPHPPTSSLYSHVVPIVLHIFIIRFDSIDILEASDLRPISDFVSILMASDLRPISSLYSHVMLIVLHIVAVVAVAAAVFATLFVAVVTVAAVRIDGPRESVVAFGFDLGPYGYRR